MLGINKSRIAGLNTLRFLTFLWIYFAHNIPKEPPKGFVMKAYTFISSYGSFGVDVFFVLSSFLLTWLAIQEKNKTGVFSIADFLKRRALRIFPLYYLVILSSFIFLPMLSKVTGNTISMPENKWLYIFFLSNYDNSEHIFALQFLWALAISEQFYWSWALLLALFKKNFLHVAQLLLFTYILVYFVLPLFNIVLPDNPLLYTLDFATGSFLAIYYQRFKAGITWKKLLLFALLSVAGMLFFRDAFYVNRIFLCGIISTFILSLNYLCDKNFIQNNRVYKLTEQLGKYSYGLYVYSGFIITATSIITIKYGLHMPFFTFLFAQLLLLVIIATFSYKYFEALFLKLSSKYKQV